MSSRIGANRANAQHSTGPRTPEGKDRSKYNATRHGLSGKLVVAPGEDPAGYDRLLQELIASYQPANTAESILVEEIAQNFWRLQRARRIETETFNIDAGGADPVIAFGISEERFANIRRYMTAIERAWHRAIAQLEKTQAIRAKQSPTPEPHPPGEGPVGFVSQNRPRPVEITELKQQQEIAIDLAPEKQTQAHAGKNSVLAKRFTQRF